MQDQTFVASASATAYANSHISQFAANKNISNVAAFSKNVSKTAPYIVSQPGFTCLVFAQQLSKTQYAQYAQKFGSDSFAVVSNTPFNQLVVMYQNNMCTLH
jgi:hypothetical protein